METLTACNGSFSDLISFGMFAGRLGSILLGLGLL